MMASSLLAGCPAGKSGSAQHPDELWSQGSRGCPAGCQVSRAAAHRHIGGLLLRGRTARVCRAGKLRCCQRCAGCLDEHSELSGECFLCINATHGSVIHLKHWVLKLSFTLAWHSGHFWGESPVGRLGRFGHGRPGRASSGAPRPAGHGRYPPFSGPDCTAGCIARHAHVFSACCELKCYVTTLDASIRLDVMGSTSAS